MNAPSTQSDSTPRRAGLDVPLTPLRFLGRAAEVHPDKPAIIDGDRTLTYSGFAGATQQLARALLSSGVTRGDTVAYVASNSAELLVAHYAVPLIGGVLVAANTRLSPDELSYICEHSNAQLLFGDSSLLSPLADQALPSVRERVELPAQDGSYADVPGTLRYSEVIDRGAPGADLPWGVDDEERTISVNYTSGTTGRPKGVMYTHRGAYLNSFGEVFHQGFTSASRYLWTLPMFHCNGWCTTWAVTAAAGTHVCLRAVRGDEIWRLIDTESISHLCGAPTVLSTLATAPDAHTLDRPLTVVTAGAPPTPTVIGKIASLGATLLHVYGLTETYGPYSVCEPQPAWAQLDADEQLVRRARQGVGMLSAEPLRVVRDEPDEHGELVDVVADGVEMGELVMRGNNVMKGYLNDPEGTAHAFAGGWFHSGDLGVMHPDGYVQILDRAKDVVISGGENISTIEVEQALASHPAVVDVAVVGMPDEKWGERPLAFVVISDDAADEAALIAHVKSRIASYKAPAHIAFVDQLPKTSTGKTRKNELRDRARE